MYEKLVSSFMNLPSTWYPALIKTLVEESYRVETWKPGGCSIFISKIEDELAKRDYKPEKPPTTSKPSDGSI